MFVYTIQYPQLSANQLSYIYCTTVRNSKPAFKTNLPHACHQKTLQEQWQTHRISDRWKLTFGNVSLEISPPADSDHPDDITFYLESVLLALLMPQLIIVLGYRTPKQLHDSSSTAGVSMPRDAHLRNLFQAM